MELEDSVVDRVEEAGLELGLLGYEPEEVADDEVRRNAAAIEGWLSQGTLTDEDTWRSEFTLISPTFGLKGRADALRRGTPVELKTGKKTPSGSRASTRSRRPATRSCLRSAASIPISARCCTRRIPRSIATRNRAISRPPRSFPWVRASCSSSSASATPSRRWSGARSTTAASAPPSRRGTRPTRSVSTASSRTPAWSFPAGSIRSRRRGRSARRSPTRNATTSTGFTSP